jgi:hypothetical protein
MKVFQDDTTEWNQVFLCSAEYLAFDKACRAFVESFDGDLRHLDYAMQQCVNEATLGGILDRRYKNG